MSDENKYAGLPNSMLPQAQAQILERKKALENVITTQRETLEKALEGIREQLKEVDSDLEYVEGRIGASV